MIDLTAAQLALEQDAVEAARIRYRDLCARIPVGASRPAVELTRRVIGGLTAAIQGWLDGAAEGNAGRAVWVTRFARQFDADELALLTLRHCMSALTSGGVRLTEVILGITTDCEAVDLEARMRKSDPTAMRRYVAASRAARGRRNRLAALRRHGEYVGVSREAEYRWTHTERTAFGAQLVRLCCESTGLFEITRRAPAGESVGSRVPNLLVPLPEALDWMRAAHETLEISAPRLLPMIVPPKPWTSMYSGGYLSNSAGHKRSFVKLQHATRGLAMPNLGPVYRAINAVQETRWAINPDTLRVLERNLGEPDCAKGVPGDSVSVPFPDRLGFMDAVPRENWTAAQLELFVDWKRRTTIAHAARGVLLGSRGATAAQAQIARQMLEYPAIWFPHTLDFRGRAYPLPSLLNPQGNDVAKGLLRFADPVPLGQHGMRWLAIHGANCYGVDKVPFDERLDWVMQHGVDIAMDARDPHRPNAMWHKADCPYQFLAFAIEWSDLMAWIGQGRPVGTFPSRLPVGLDGSCNGLQHYSAILRDPIGGAATNLLPSDAPRDIYALVARETAAIAETDLADTEKRPFAAFWMQQGITRAWTKRNTMTLPYGVTQLGMRDQIWEEVRSHCGAQGYAPFFEPLAALGSTAQGACVSWLADANYTATGRVVVAARAAMDWLREVAKVCNEAAVPVRWETPDGFLLVQHYTQTESICVKLFGQSLSVHLQHRTDKLDTRKQTTGIAPNFVHAVDACHMRAVVRRLLDHGVTAFAMIHDSFGTHAGNCELLAQVTRDEFVDLHKGRVLASFADGIGLPGIPPLPSEGTLDLEAVRGSEYFFA